jgi:hypothetical protein
MVQSRSSLRLTLEASQSLRIVGHIVGQKLEGNKTMQPRILGLVNDTHPSPAEFFDDAVVRDCPADHKSKILRL